MRKIARVLVVFLFVTSLVACVSSNAAIVRATGQGIVTMSDDSPPQPGNGGDDKDKDKDKDKDDSEKKPKGKGHAE